MKNGIKRWRRHASPLNPVTAADTLAALDQAVRRPQYVTLQEYKQNAINEALGLIDTPPSKKDFGELILKFYRNTLGILKQCKNKGMQKLHKRLYRYL